MKPRMSFKNIIRNIKIKLKSGIQTRSFILEKVPKDMQTKQGIYILSENGRPVYVGRSNRIKGRLKSHIGRRHNQASFAYLLAREAFGLEKASYKKNFGRDHLMSLPKFRTHFNRAVKRIRNMRVRVIEEIDQTNQALLEIYAAHKLKTKYNNFKTH